MSPSTSTKAPSDAHTSQAGAQGHGGQSQAEAASDLRVKDKRHTAKLDDEPTVPEGAGADAAEGEPEVLGAGADQVAALTAKLAQSEARLSATLAQYKDALDEFANAKARLKRDITKEIQAGRRSTLSELLEVVDNLERAIEAAAAKAADDSFYKGVCMVRDQFLAKLEQMGVRRRQALHQPFDPDHFEAISTVPVTDPAQDGVVVGVVRDCYLLGEETLRYGMVAVGKLQGK